ncbi:hypothetical protein [Actinomadura madurae]|uniref:hypothetical protein n=1 Tax=Actinomadura madurae TaxID=1993 RepID=UPI0020D24596|nr:hypothetical protein [Actinomadura madurae]MCP9969288.1 hypothetical protein [Actinomadura madurae]MCQ0006723.1 hypothetical protein [Actinomadura madurae]
MIAFATVSLTTMTMSSSAGWPAATFRTKPRAHPTARRTPGSMISPTTTRSRVPSTAPPPPSR